MATNPMGRLGSKLIGAPKSMLNGDTAPAGYRRGQTHPPSPPRPTVRCPPATPFLADGKKVLARTAGIRYSAVLPGWMPWSRATTGENVLRTYEGEGRLLISTTPHWRYMIAQQRQTHDPADDLMMGSSHPAIPDIDPDF